MLPNMVLDRHFSIQFAQTQGSLSPAHWEHGQYSSHLGLVDSFGSLWMVVKCKQIDPLFETKKSWDSIQIIETSTAHPLNGISTKNGFTSTESPKFFIEAHRHCWSASGQKTTGATSERDQAKGGRDAGPPRDRGIDLGSLGFPKIQRQQGHEIAEMLVQKFHGNSRNPTWSIFEPDSSFGFWEIYVIEFVRHLGGLSKNGGKKKHEVECRVYPLETEGGIISPFTCLRKNIDIICVTPTIPSNTPRKT